MLRTVMELSAILVAKITYNKELDTHKMKTSHGERGKVFTSNACTTQCVQLLMAIQQIGTAVLYKDLRIPRWNHHTVQKITAADGSSSSSTVYQECQHWLLWRAPLWPWSTVDILTRVVL